MLHALQVQQVFYYKEGCASSYVPKEPGMNRVSMQLK